MPGSFLDSNVLLYFASADPAKSGRAEALMDAGGTINVLVLNEMASVMRRKFAYSWDQAARVLDIVRRAFRVEPLLLPTHERGLRVAERYMLGVYDAMIVAAALDAGCETLWSEDMHEGLVVEATLTIRNPFRQA
jgi:predicted nucleic acid-binding protein